MSMKSKDFSNILAIVQTALWMNVRNSDICEVSKALWKTDWVIFIQQDLQMYFVKLAIVHIVSCARLLCGIQDYQA